MDPLEEAIEVANGVAALASGIGVSDSAPHMWRKRGKVPAEHCPAIERFTRERGRPVTCERLRPDVPWDVLREQAAPAGVLTAAPVPAATATAEASHAD